MKKSTSGQIDTFDALCVVASGIISIYVLGVADAFGFDHFLPLMVSFTVMLALLARDVIKRRPNAPRLRPIHPLAIALGILAIALFLSSFLIHISGIRSDTIDVYRQVSMLVIGMSPFLLAYRVTMRHGAGDTIVWMAHSVIFICALSIGLEVTGIYNVESYANRYFGFLGDPVALILTFPLIIYAANSRHLLLAISLVLLFFTLSRGPIILALVGLLAIIAFRQGKSHVDALLVIGIGAVISVVMSNSVIALTQRYTDIDSENARFRTPLAGLQLFSESPIFGHGYAALNYYYPPYDDLAAQIYGRYRDGILPTASSTWVQMLSDGGLIVAAPYFLLIALAALYCLPRIRRWHNRSCSQATAGAGVWLIVNFYFNHSAGWLLAGGAILPLVMTLLGIVTGVMVYERRQVTQMRKQFMDGRRL